MGNEMKALLNKTIKPFAIYSLLVLALSIPAYFYIINYIWQTELDKHHYITRNNIETELNAHHLNDSNTSTAIAQFNRLQSGYKLMPSETGMVKKDSVYSYYAREAFDEEEEQFRGLSTQITIHNKRYNLVIETNMEESDETVLAIASVTIIFFLLLLIGLIILNRRLSRRIWEPFYNTLDQLKKFNLTSQEPVALQQSDIREFEELNRTLSKLIEQNISAFRQQKEFAENASHELQTPLAIIKSKIDLLLQDNTLTQEQSENIASLNKPLSRVSRINKNLLLLAKLDNHQYADDEKIPVNEVLNENMDLLSEHIKNKHLTLTRHIQDHLDVTANRSLLEIALSNLLFNAIRHSPEHGALHIELTGNVLVIANTGHAPLNPDMLFRRFMASSQASLSSGLGLAIVSEICKRYGWLVDYRFEKGLHRFSIQF